MDLGCLWSSLMSLCAISEWLHDVEINVLWRLDHLLQDSLFYLPLKILSHDYVLGLVALLQNDCSSYP